MKKKGGDVYKLVNIINEFEVTLKFTIIEEGIDLELVRKLNLVKSNDEQLKDAEKGLIMLFKDGAGIDSISIENISVDVNYEEVGD